MRPVAISSQVLDTAGTGASKVTQDIAQIMAQLPPVVESISGVSLASLIQRIPGFSEAAPPSRPPPLPERK